MQTKAYRANWGMRLLIMRIALGIYPKKEGEEIFRYFEGILGEPRTLETHWLWSMRF